MRKLLLVGIILSGLLVTGCATVRIEAPTGKKIQLVSDVEPVNYTAKKRVFYALWGLVPITNNSTAPMLEGKNIDKVRVKTYYDVVDFLITAVLGNFTITSQTVEINAHVKNK